MEITEKYWLQLKQGAKKRKIPFLITKDEAWKIFQSQNKRCAITNIELNFTCFGYRGTASLDRINSNKPYVWHNVQWLLSDINIMKKSHSLDYFKYLCHLVASQNQSSFA